MAEQINLRAFRQKANRNKSVFKKFLKKISKKPPRGLDRIAVETDIEVWKEIDCLSCANCCKTMSPTYTGTDVKRIATHLKMTPKEFRKKWLRKDRSGDWMNKTEPCQFLDLSNNYCSIYEVRPRDCAGFPHHTKRHTSQYTHVFEQNIEYCPATYKLVEKMRSKIAAIESKDK
jgi:uncharacterized protein